MKCILRKYLRKLNQVFGKDKRKNQDKIKKLKLEALRNSMVIFHDRDPPCDEIYRQAQEQSRLLMKVFDRMFAIEFSSDEELFDSMSQFTNKNEIQQIFEHLYLLDTMQNIFQNRKMADPSTYNFFDHCDKRVYKLKEARTWEEAQDISDEYNQVQPQRNEKHLPLSHAEIRLIKDSPIFKRLFENPNEKYMRWYNEAKVSYHDNKNYTFLITDHFKAHLVEKNLKVHDRKHNPTMPLWKKRIRNEREVYLHYDT